METMNHEYYVSSEIAKLLEKAGFDWKCRKCYDKGVVFDMEPDEIRTRTPQHSSYDVLAPTLDIAQRWLREVKNVDVFAYRNEPTNKFESIVSFDKEWSTTGMCINAYEEAVETGIKKALEIILEKGE